ncbi:C-type lectin domain family 4 member D-like [Saccostrea echinata]|uniref:C-type lectin domain family 4 member D-like n=1 Tax=Saccostrea echinata TaxID=191078 RepID=UPI002A817D9F|nr:C-type lectin domain family 4 member D-like [Saccostrea echinata]
MWKHSGVVVILHSAEVQNEYHYPTFLATVDKSYESLKEQKDDGRYERLKNTCAVEPNLKEIKGVEKETNKLETHGVSMKTWVAIVISVVFLSGFVTMTSLFAVQLNKRCLGSIQEGLEKGIEQNQSLQLQISRLKNIIVSPHFWSSNGNSIYMLFLTERTWFDSQVWCSNTGGTLAEIETVDENNFIRNSIISLREANIIRDGVWVGGTDENTEGIWKWASRNTNITFTFWAPNEPNNFRNNENCLELSEEKGWAWNDNNCDETKTFLCEILQSK